MDKILCILKTAHEIFPLTGNAKHNFILSDIDGMIQLNIFVETHIIWMYTTLDENDLINPIETLEKVKNDFNEYFEKKGIKKV